MLVAAEVPGVLDILRRHQVPARPATAQMIERGELAGDGERLLVAGRRRRHQADAAGVLRHRGEQGHRLEHRRPVGWAVGGEQGRLVHLAHAVAVSQEHQVELAALGDLRHLDHAGELHGGRRKRIPVPPAGKMPAQRAAGEAEHHHDPTSAKAAA